MVGIAVKNLMETIEKLVLEIMKLEADREMYKNFWLDERRKNEVQNG